MSSGLFGREHILVFRKGGRREFDTTAAKANRRRSAFFHHERNAWFSDLWTDLTGTSQALKANAGRSRSGAFPLELPYRLIQMFSVYGDTALDPFLGTGTTSLAAKMSGRNSIGVEIDESCSPAIHETFLMAVQIGQRRAEERITAQRELEPRLAAQGKGLKYRNGPHGVAVRSGQEVDLVITAPIAVSTESPSRFVVEHGTISRPVVESQAPHALEAEALTEGARDDQAAYSAS